MIPLIFQEFYPSSIFSFLYDLAKLYIQSYREHPSKLYCEKVEKDFLTICALNALFGDPRIHLVQLHPASISKFGDRNFDRALRLYSDKKYADTKNSLETQKQRRNAVTELLRFVCSRNFPIDVKQIKLSEVETYRKVKSLLLNGDIVNAVRLLNYGGM